MNLFVEDNYRHIALDEVFNQKREQSVSDITFNTTYGRYNVLQIAEISCSSLLMQCPRLRSISIIIPTSNFSISVVLYSQHQAPNMARFHLKTDSEQCTEQSWPMT